MIDETHVRVRYAETDAMGIVHHSQYVIWFEEGRSSFMRSLGFSYAEVERLGYFFVIAELGARFRAPAFYDELITVRTRLSALGSRGLTFAYEVVRPTDLQKGTPEQVLVTGFTRLICTDRSGQVARLPVGFRAGLEALVQPAS